MRTFLFGVAGVVAVGAVVAVAFGAGALWIYGFFAIFAVAFALDAGVGGNLINTWARRHFERGGATERRS